jgi:hypothetical protein
MVIAEKQDRLNIGHVGAEFSGANAKMVKNVTDWTTSVAKLSQIQKSNVK